MVLNLNHNEKMQEDDIGLTNCVHMTATRLIKCVPIVVTTHVETVCLLSNRKCAGNEPKSELAPDLGECRGTAESVKGFLRKPDTHVDLTLDMEDYYRIKDQEKAVK